MRIIIHIGPPKTGTSAIQKGLVERHADLLKVGVYYPKHELDPNGISSGNLESIFDRDSTGTLAISETKVENLTRDASEKKCNTVLLSSEFFFKQLSILHKAFPRAIYIAYIRFELEVLESSYNQSVKRHGKTEQFVLPQKLSAHSLRYLSRMIDKIGVERFLLRPYSKQLFYKKNILCDFLHAIGINGICDEKLTDDAPVNTSYSIQGLELKRWFNKFSLGPLQNSLDRFLQYEGRDSQKYSLMTNSMYMHSKAVLLSQLEEFCNIYPVSKSSEFIEICQNQNQSEKVTQKLDEKDFLNLLKAYIGYEESNPEMLYQILASLDPEKLSHGDQHRIAQAIELVPFRVRFRINHAAKISRIKKLVGLV